MFKRSIQNIDYHTLMLVREDQWHCLLHFLIKFHYINLQPLTEDNPINLGQALGWEVKSLPLAILHNVHVQLTMGYQLSQEVQAHVVVRKSFRRNPEVNAFKKDWLFKNKRCLLRLHNSKHICWLVGVLFFNGGFCTIFVLK
jgi:hypothetical protein